MCGTAMRGADALPGSKATSRAKGSYRNLGDLVSGRRRRVRGEEYGGPQRGGEGRESRRDGEEKSEAAIVAVKKANKAKKSTAEASGGKVAAEPGARSVHSDCMGCGIEPRKIRHCRCREFSFARRQHVRHRHARC